MKKFFTILFIFCVIACSKTKPAPVVESFEDCVAAGYAITRTLPPHCVTPEGDVFVQGLKGPAEDAGCIDACGNGVCESIVCLGSNCPCAETLQNCPEDCGRV